MPKLKTKSSAKKRFRFTASGLLKCAQARKQHNMRKRSNNMLRDARGTTIMAPCDTKIVLNYMPYNRKLKGDKHVAR